jgi:hypothetical protein
MNPTASSPKRWKPNELRRLPADQREAILRAAAAKAEEDYRRDLSLTDFEAFGKDDLHGDSADAELR